MRKGNERVRYSAGFITSDRKCMILTPLLSTDTLYYDTPSLMAMTDPSARSIPRIRVQRININRTSPASSKLHVTHNVGLKIRLKLRSDPAFQSGTSSDLLARSTSCETLPSSSYPIKQHFGLYHDICHELPLLYNETLRRVFTIPSTRIP